MTFFNEFRLQNFLHACEDGFTLRESKCMFRTFRNLFFISLSFFVLDDDISLSMKLTQLCPKSICSVFFV